MSDRAATREALVEEVDRSTCPAGVHGTVYAYARHRCRCADARAARREARRDLRRCQGIPVAPVRVRAGRYRRMLRQLVDGLGHTQADLAGRLGWSTSRVSDLVRGARPNITVETAGRIRDLYVAIVAEAIRDSMRVLGFTPSPKLCYTLWCERVSDPPREETPMFDFAAARTAIANGLTAAVEQGWGHEAATLYGPVTAALATGIQADAIDAITDAQRAAVADTETYRGLFLEQPLIAAREALETPAERAYLDALAADMAAFLAGEPVPAATPVYNLVPALF